MAGSVAAMQWGPWATLGPARHSGTFGFTWCGVMSLGVRGAAVSPQKLANVSVSEAKTRPTFCCPRRESNLKAVGFCVQRTAGRPRDRHHKHSTSAAGR